MCNIIDWIKIPNHFKNSWIWSSNEKRGAWIDLIFRANHEDFSIVFKGSLIKIQSGEVVTSIRQLSDDWKWGRGKVLNFLKMLEDDNLICRVSDNKCTLIKICNYSIYKLASEITKDVVEETVEKIIEDTTELIEVQRINNQDVEEYKEENNEETEENIEIEQEKKKVNTRVVRYYEDEELNQAFIDYAEMRKKIRKPMTDRAVTLAKNKIAKYAAIPFSDEINKTQAIKILEQSVLNSWQGIFPLKDDENENETEWEDV